MQLKNKVIVITGASRGLGAALALSCAPHGARIVVSGRNKKLITAVADRINGHPVVADVTKPGQVNRLARAAIKKFGHIDIWINNAGTRIPHGPAERINAARMHQMLEVNLFGTIYGSQAALTHMYRRKRGIIINILSTSALTGRANSAGYCASKYATTGFTNSIRLEAKPRRVTVIGIYPGGMRTHFFDEQKPANYDDYMDAAYVADRIIKNVLRNKPREELVIKRK